MTSQCMSYKTFFFLFIVWKIKRKDYTKKDSPSYYNALYKLSQYTKKKYIYMEEDVDNEKEKRLDDFLIIIN